MSVLPALSDFVGLDAAAGGAIAADAHLLQSIRDILTTPIGSRVMRRDYGSRLFELVDAPMNPGLVADIVAASAEALAKWEPRISLGKVKVVSALAGQFELALTFDLNGQTVQLQAVV